MNQITTYIIGSTPPDTTSVRDFVSLDTRSREIGHRSGVIDYDAVQLIVVRQYASSNGTEYFISVEDQMGYLYGFARLCCPDEGGIADWPGLGVGTAMIRELHVYGQLASLTSSKHKAITVVQNDASGGDGESNLDISHNVQHTGIGRQLMSLAEQITHTKGYARLSVISGIGVREYYKLLGYHLSGSYMVKELV